MGWRAFRQQSLLLRSLHQLQVKPLGASTVLLPHFDYSAAIIDLCVFHTVARSNNSQYDCDEVCTKRYAVLFTLLCQTSAIFNLVKITGSAQVTAECTPGYLDTGYQVHCGRWQSELIMLQNVSTIVRNNGTRTGGARDLIEQFNMTLTLDCRQWCARGTPTHRCQSHSPQLLVLLTLTTSHN